MNRPAPQKNWHETQELPIAMINPNGEFVLTPLYTAEGDQGHEINVCVMAERYTGVGHQWAQKLIILVPGICGHYDCGGVIEVSLN